MTLVTVKQASQRCFGVEVTGPRILVRPIRVNLSKLNFVSTSRPMYTTFPRVRHTVFIMAKYSHGHH